MRILRGRRWDRAFISRFSLSRKKPIANIHKFAELGMFYEYVRLNVTAEVEKFASLSNSSTRYHRESEREVFREEVPKV